MLQSAKQQQLTKTKELTWESFSNAKIFNFQIADFSLICCLCQQCIYVTFSDRVVKMSLNVSSKSAMILPCLGGKQEIKRF